tara:strand:- start:225 stop:410 length:186 start_codon:yes stop_codon:yes gene_type:complete
MFISQFNFYFNYAWLKAGRLQEVAINAIAKYKANPEYRTSEVKLLRTSQYQIIRKSLLPGG